MHGWVISISLNRPVEPRLRFHEALSLQAHFVMRCHEPSKRTSAGCDVHSITGTSGEDGLNGIFGNDEMPHEFKAIED